MSAIILKNIVYNNNSYKRGYLGSRLIYDTSEIPTSYTYAIEKINYPSSIEFSATSATVKYDCNTYSANTSGDKVLISGFTKNENVGPFEINTSKTDRKLNSGTCSWQTESFVWKIYQEPDGTIIISDADYVRLTYSWDEGDDVDTKLSLLPSQGAILGTKYTGNVGYIGYSGNTDNALMLSGITWGGDNTFTGSESNLISIEKILDPSIISVLKENDFNSLCIPITAYYYVNEEYIGTQLSINLDAYSGGTMYLDEFIYENEGGIKLQTSHFDTKLNDVYLTDYNQIHGFIYVDLITGIVTLKDIDSFYSPYDSKTVLNKTPIYTIYQNIDTALQVPWISDNDYVLNKGIFRLTYNYDDGTSEEFKIYGYVKENVGSMLNLDYTDIEIDCTFTLYNQNIPWKCIITGGTEGNNIIITLTDGSTKKLANLAASLNLFNHSFIISNVFLSDNVTSIEDNAFSGCLSLSSVTIGNAVASIGKYAFYCCTSLSSVTIPNSVTSIGNYAFDGCTSLSSVTIPNSVTSIGNYAFDECTKLALVTIGSGVTSIGNYAFSNCTSLSSVTIPDSVSSIGKSAFEYCTSLSSIKYNGTTDQWKNNVVKESTWHYGVPSTTVVTCTDGTVPLD